MGKFEKIETAYLYPTLKCNLMCAMCVSSANLHESKYTDSEMTLKQYRKLINDLYSLGVRTFDISGGEPILRQDLLQILKEIKKNDGTKIVLVSNGTLWNRDFVKAEQLLEYLDDVHISIDSSDASVHDQIRGVEGTFASVCENVRRIREHGYQNVNINTVLSQQNYKDVYNILDMTHSLGCKSISFLKLLDVTESSRKMNNLLYKKDYLYVLNEILKWKNEKGDLAKRLLVKIVLPGKLIGLYKNHKLSELAADVNVKAEFDPLRGCNAFRKSIMITSDGYVTGCTAFLGKESIYAGNVLWDDWETILQKFLAYRNMIKEREKKIKEDKCGQCEEWNVCRGGCPAIALNYDGVFDNPESVCKSY